MKHIRDFCDYALALYKSTLYLLIYLFYTLQYSLVLIRSEHMMSIFMWLCHGNPMGLELCG